MGSSSGRTNSTRRRGVKRTRDDDELGDARPASGGTDEPAAPIRRSQDPKGDCGPLGSVDGRRGGGDSKILFVVFDARRETPPSWQLTWHFRVTEKFACIVSRVLCVL